MANKPSDSSEKKPGRIAQIYAVAKIVHQQNPRALPLIALAALAVLVVFVVAGLLTHTVVYTTVLGVLTAVTVAFVIFGQVAQRTQYAMLEGQRGAAAAIMEGMRGDWTVTPAVAANRDMDVVHRVVGRPGVILVGEGQPARVARLIAAEKKRVSRVAYDITIYDVQVGDAEGQVPLRKLQHHVMRLPRNLKKPQVAELNYRLRALPQSTPIPHGPLPKGARLPKAPRPRLR